MKLEDVAQRLAHACDALSFDRPVTHVYNPLVYAWEPHRSYLRKYGQGKKEVLFVGMNPGPFGMAQTGVPFGDVSIVTKWLSIEGTIAQPRSLHPARPIAGFQCARGEVSGQRLWGWAAARFGSAQRFFSRFFVTNYCPLVFMEASGKNRTPDKLSRAEQVGLYRACDDALASTIRVLDPKVVVGVGVFAEARLRACLNETQGHAPKVGRVLHPSPASPIANRGWASHMERELEALGIAL